MKDQEIEKTDKISVYCAGEKGVLAHPKIYLKVDPKLKNIVCPYCRKIFQL